VITDVIRLHEMAMRKTTTKQLFKSIDAKDQTTLISILDAHSEALEAFGEHNRLVRDKTPLMYALQCWNISLANMLLDRGANADASMAGGPRSSVLSLCMQFAYCDSDQHDDWIELATRLIDNGAEPNSGLWPALHGFGGIVERVDLIRLCLERGADPDRQVGNSGNTVRELVNINQKLYTQEILDLFGVAP